MALGYKATTNIKYGAADGTVTEFGVGDPVTGLSRDAMKELWDNGALEQFDTVEEVPEEGPEASDEQVPSDLTPAETDD